MSPSWIYNWVKDPKLVWAETKMPNLRLTDAEAADITAYLSSLKNDPWTAKPLPKVDTAALDDVVKEFLRNGSTETEASDKLKKMSLDEKNLYAGERLIRRYGCFGCHNIPGMEKEQPIGTELTEAGSKLVSQLDFGFLDIEHDRASWYSQKLHDPRSFDVGRVKTPEELLRMPNFTFKDADVSAITMVLTSLVKDKVAQEMREPVPAAIVAGRQLVDEKNCKGCHVIEHMGGDIRGYLKDNQTLWPPDLNTEGFKTQPAWLMKFIKDPSMVRLRNFLDARMPTFHFTEKEVDTLTTYFSALDKVDYPLINPYIETTPERLKTGADLFTKLQCGKCHPTGTSNPTTPQKEWAPNLNLTQARLRPDWLIVWLQDPQKIFPGARMPASWPEYPKSSIKDIYDGDAKAQIQAVRDHIYVTLGGGQKATATN